MLNLNAQWFMAQDYFESVAHQYTAFEIDVEKFEAFLEERSPSDDGQSLFVKSEAVAHIIVKGAITQSPDFFFSLMGGGNAVWGDITQAIRDANADPDVERIVLEINSPGGEVAGMFETALAVRNSGKPVEAEVTDMAASAAFALAAQAGKITVNNRMAQVGSVGIVTQRMISDTRVTIRSTDAPKKNPDASTEAGIQAIKDELDPLHAEFVELIAAGRSKALGETITVAQVNREFGRGGMVIAGAAVAAKMVDAISTASTAGGGRVPATSEDSTETETDAMTLDDLKAKHPEIYKAVFDEGVAHEHDRVSAHVAAGNAVGKPDIALALIEDGSNFTDQKVQAQYFAARANADDTNNRNADEEHADTGTAAQTAGDDAVVDEAAIAAHTNEVFDGLSNKVS